MSAHILVADDEKELADMLELYLTNDGHTVHKAYTAAEALDCAASTDLDLAVLDVMFPDGSGFQICKKIREKHCYPIIMLTAKSAASDKILGLTIGADDYITKPFNPLELTARVKTQLRRYIRYNTAAPSVEPARLPVDEISIRGLTISKSSHKCSLNENELNLTPIEFNILWYLCEHKGSVISSEELFAAVWGEAYLDSNNTVMTHIARLREKMKEPPRKPKFVKTVWGVGYTIE